MSLDLLKKEILDHLLSLRLILAFVLIIILLVASSVLFVAEYKTQVSDFNAQVNDNLTFLSKNLTQGIFQAFSFTRQNIYRRPNPLGFLAEGREKDLPNAFRVSAFRLEGPDYALRGNPLLGDFEALDWSFIVGVVLSFVAILLASDGVNGERQNGTLRLIFSNPVPRARVLISKYLSTMILLAIPVVLGGLMGLLVISGSGLVPLTSAEWAKIGLVLIVSLLYLSVFVLLGLLLSTALKESQASLIVSLLVWVVLVIVIPSGASLTSKLWKAVPDADSVAAQADRAWEEAKINFDKAHPNKEKGYSGNWSPGESLLMAVNMATGFDRVYFNYEDQKISQVRFGQHVSRTSPAGLYQSAVLSITGSGLLHYESFARQARRYRDELRGLIEQNYPFDKVNAQPEIRDQISQLKVDYQVVPKFEEKLLSVREGWSKAIWDTGLLALLNVILFAATWVLFLRYDAR
jgi:ABC-type transport system involved in multi-copper enzyme maturation permease subunit